MKKSGNYLKALGPGLLWAGAAIGVSHLVQSTRAGAIYGFDLVFIILLVNLFKYPFFEFAPRYAAATGENLLQGYRRMGKWAVWLYLLLTLGTMFTVQGGVTVVTAGIFSYVFPGLLSINQWAYGILLVSALIVSSGKYSVLDRLVKVIIILLAVSSLIAVVAAFGKGFHPDPELTRTFQWQFEDVALLIAFAGWMPSAIDISVWHSVWTIAKRKETGYAPKLKEVLFDFNVGYIGTVFLALGFLSLGALVMYGTGVEFSASGTDFAGQLIHLFTSNLGEWSYILIATAALTTMASTTITCIDAFPRVLTPATELLKSKVDGRDNAGNNKVLARTWLGILLAGTFVLIGFFLTSMRVLIDLATTLSFLTAPVLGYLNYRVITGNNVPQEAQPKRWLVVLSWIGLLVLTGFSVYYLVWKFVL